MDDLATSHVSFPPLPATVSEVSRLIASRDTDLASLTTVVKRDPSVSVQVLRRVNSAYFGVKREVTSVDQAVRLLGFTNVASIALVEGMHAMQTKFGSVPDLFRHVAQEAVFVARFAQTFAGGLGLAQRQAHLGFTSGLVFSASRLILLYNWPERYRDLPEQAPGPLPTASAEEQEFNESHRTLAPRVCGPWGLPRRICSVLGTTAEAAHPEQRPRRALHMAVVTGAHVSMRQAAGRAFAVPPEARSIPNVDVRALARRAADDAAAFAG